MEGGDLVSDIAQVSERLRTLRPHIKNQFFAFYAQFNYPGCMGGISARYTDLRNPLASVYLGELTSRNIKTGRIRKHFCPVVSMAGGCWGQFGSLALVLSDGRVLFGGGDPDGPRGGEGNLVIFPCLSRTRIVSVAIGAGHCLMLDSCGRVFSMLQEKELDFGQLGRQNGNAYAPAEVSISAKIRKIAAGPYVSLFLDATGNLFVCGRRTPFFAYRIESPKRVATGIKDVFTGWGSCTIFVQTKYGKILSIGENDFGQRGMGKPFSESSISSWKEWSQVRFESGQPLERSKLKKMACSENASFLLLEDGTLYSCGKEGENGFKTAKNRFTEYTIFSTRGERVLDISCQRSHGIFLTDDGRVYVTLGDKQEETSSEGISDVIPGSALKEIIWRDDADRLRLRSLIASGRKFEICVWGRRWPFVFIMEKSLQSELGDRLRKMVFKLEYVAKKLPDVDNPRSKETTNPPDVITTLRAFSTFLEPMNTIASLEKFLHFFDFSSSIDDGEDKIFEVYKRHSYHELKNPKVFTTGKQKSAVKKISSILLIYETLRKNSESEKHFKLLPAELENSVRLDTIDQIYSNLFRYLHIVRNTLASESSIQPNSEVMLAPYSLFNRFGISDFDLVSLVTTISSIERSLEEKLSVLRKTLQKDMESPSTAKISAVVKPGNPLQSFLMLHRTGTFYGKMSFLVMVVVRRFLRSLSRELSKKDTEFVLYHVAPEFRWKKLGYKEDSKAGGALNSLRALHQKVLNAGEVAKKRSRSELQDTLISFLRLKVEESKRNKAKILRELAEVFRALGIVNYNRCLDREEVSKILKRNFRIDFDTLYLGLLSAPRKATRDIPFSVLGFKTPSMWFPVLLHEIPFAADTKNPEIPAVKGHCGEPISIFIQLYSERKLGTSDIRVTFVHLFSGARLGSYLSKGSVSIEEVRTFNTFKITVKDFKYPGQFALVVDVRPTEPTGETHQHLYRGIFITSAKSPRQKESGQRGLR